MSTPPVPIGRQSIVAVYQLNPSDPRQYISSAYFHPVCHEAYTWSAHLNEIARRHFNDPNVRLVTNPTNEQTHRLTFLRLFCKNLHVTFNFCSGLKGEVWLKYQFPTQLDGNATSLWSVEDRP